MGGSRLKIAVLTSSRADYGIYLPLLHLMQKDPGIELSIIAFGSHLKEQFGNTIDQIKNDKPITITSGLMTRFMMTLDHAVELVLFAFKNGNNGDLFVQKSPAATIKTLSEALKELYDSSAEVDEIGIRHGEKMYETLVTKEEMMKAEDLGNYFRVIADNRDLNYEKYFSKGIDNSKKLEEYNSDTTQQLDVNSMKQLLMELPEIQLDLKSKK